MSFSIKLISGLIQKNNNTFKLVKAKDVDFSEATAIASANVADGDLFILSDIDENVSITKNADVKKITAGNLKSYILGSGGSTIGIASGGTGLTSISYGDILYGPSSGTSLSKLSIGAAHSFLTSNGAAPQWSNSLSSLTVTGLSELANADFSKTNVVNNPIVNIESINSGGSGGQLRFRHESSSPAQNDITGKVVFISKNDNDEDITYSEFFSQINKVEDGQESGRFRLSLMAYGSSSTAFDIKGSTSSAGVIDVDIAAGATSVTTIRGALTMGSTPFVNSSGVIQSGATWNGGVINSAYLPSNTAYLSGSQTFSGTKTFSGSLQLTSNINFEGPAIINGNGNGSLTNDSDVIFQISEGDIQNSSENVLFQMTKAGKIKAIGISPKTGTVIEFDGDVKVKGNSPGFIEGPDSDTFTLKSNTDLIFQVDADQASSSGNNTFQFKNGSNSTIASLTEAGVLTLNSALPIASGGTGAANAADARTALGVDASGTDNSTNVTLSGGPDYITISGQTITRNQINLTTDVTGSLPISNGGTGLSSVSGNAGKFLKVNSSANGFELETVANRTVTAGGNTLGSSESLNFVAGSNITISESGGDVTIASTDTNTQLTQVQVEDIVGAMLDGAETGISVTYNSTANNIDFTVSDLTVAGDSGSTGMTPGDTLTIAGGSNVTTSMSGDTLTISASTSSSSNTLELVPSSASDPAAGVNSAIIIKEGNTSTVAGKVYYLAPNGTWVLANAGAEGTRSGLLGVAVDSNSTTHGMVVKGVVVMSTHSGSAGNGKTIYLSETNGEVTTSAPSSVRILGSIISHNSSRCEIYFNPDNFNGQAANPAASFTDNKSLTFDGTGDYAVADLPSNWGKNEGTISFWVNLNITDDVSKYLISCTTGDGNFNDFIIINYFKVSSSRYALVARQRRTISGTTVEHVTVAQQSSSYHGRPLQRTAASFNSIQQNYNSIRTSDTWTHIAVTWDADASYNYNSTGYEGNQTIYVNGTKVGEGTGTLPSHNGIGTNNEMDYDRTADLTKIYLQTLSPSHAVANLLMNDLAIWSSALNDNNITAIYNSGTPTDLTTAAGNYNQQGNLVGYWKMEDNTNDSSSNSNNLTLYGDTTYSSSTP